MAGEFQERDYEDQLVSLKNNLKTLDFSDFDHYTMKRMSFLIN